MRNPLSRAALLSLAGVLTFASFQASPEDIDIFTGPSDAVAESNPNVLFVLDNTSNWSGNDQHFPNEKQGQAEVAAISNVINDASMASVVNKMNLGVMEFVTSGNANNIGGFVRFAIKPMSNATYKADLTTRLQTIYNNIQSPDEKRNSNTEYGNLLYDVYNYLTGGQHSESGAGTPTALADPDGYDAQWSNFRQPLSEEQACAKTVIIFIGNPNSTGPRADGAGNGTILTNLGGSVSPQIAIPGLATTTQTTTESIGFTSACSSTAPASVPAEFTTTCANDYNSCAVNGAISTTTLSACSGTQRRFDVIKTTAGGSTTTTTNEVGPTLGTSACYTSAAACGGDNGGLTCPGPTTVTDPDDPQTTITTSYTCSYSCGAATADACTAQTSSSTSGPTAGTPFALSPNGCSVYTGANNNSLNPATDANRPACPAQSGPTTVGNTTTTTTYTCSYSKSPNLSCAGSGSNRRWTIYGTATPFTTTTTTTSTPRNKFQVTQNRVKTVTRTTTASTPVTLGNSLSCSSSAASCSTADWTSECSGGTCSCGGTGTTTGTCKSGTQRYQVTGTVTRSVLSETGTMTTPSSTVNADEWARFFNNKGVPVSAAAGATRISVKTYAIDVYKDKPNGEHTGYMFSMAKNGGGKYFSATNRDAIIDAIKEILIDIQAVNSTFASASLPVNATNRAQNENQVFIGMFRPDGNAQPRWYGNMKRYQLIETATGIDLGDVNGNPAVTSVTGFLTDCATSWWTTDSGTYWQNVAGNPAQGECPTTGFSAFSDSPDGPLVEKGAVAEIIRKGNNPPTTNTSPTYTVNRTVLTGQPSTSALPAFTTTSSGLSAQIVNFTLGQDQANEDNDSSFTETRPSIHGDVVHSRPQPVNYGGTTGIVVYYGANDGTLRAVRASDGKELWAYIAPEHYNDLSRLFNNVPRISYPSIEDEEAVAKDYFFDGSIGLYQTATGISPAKSWIFPSMRRGGRMVYAFDVTTPTAPRLKWKVGCPSMDSDDACEDNGGTDITGIGQTWSIPGVAFIKGYSVDDPVIIMGGGYDACEDANSSSPSCASGKGKAVYVLDADTGQVLRTFTTDRAVAADVSLIDIDPDGLVDYAYVADTGGNIYRIDFVNASKQAQDADDWTMTKVAFTNGDGRKFLFRPALFYNNNQVFLALGSGDREHPLTSHYPYPEPAAGKLGVTNRFYVFKDSLADVDGATMLDLDDTSSTGMSDFSIDPGCDVPSTDSILTSGGKKGWFMDLDDGEQTVTSAVIAGGFAIFSTNRPTPTDPDGTSCSANLGEARGYFANLLTSSGGIGTASQLCGGDRSAVFVGGGLPPSPVLATVPVDGEVRTIVIGAVDKTAPDSEDNSAIEAQQVTPPGDARRRPVYWYKSTGE